MIGWVPCDRMSEHATPSDGEPRLYDLLDDAGREWLDEIVRLFNDGAYDEAVEAFVADEAAVHGVND